MKKNAKSNKKEPEISAEELKQFSAVKEGDQRRVPAEQCCVPVEKRRYDGKIWIWKSKLFFRKGITQLFHMPFGIAKIMSKDYPKLLGSGNLAENVWLIREKKRVQG